ncbi:MAG TPA: glycosyltransferase [Gaiellales bacterium]|nr:glycosyltransferase [Gaiellales bacterium]
MALRTSSIAPSQATPAAPADWRGRVDLAVSVAAARLAAADLDGLAAVFADLATWEDEQRAYQARCRLAELVLAYRPDDVDAWVRAFIAGATHLLAALEREPREPVLLNHVGVLLYELCEAGAAADLFRAAARLDPELAHARANLEHARERARSGARLPGVGATRTRQLAERARRLAGRARPVKKLTLSLCMIVKDEEEMLPGCLEPLRGVVDEMIVVDTGSTDRTVEIAESYGATVVHFPWNGSFADARNASIEAASGDWLIYLDADEHMEADDARHLRALLGRTWREGFYLVETNYTGGSDAGSAVTHMALRVWRNRPQYRFAGRIHEQKTHTMPTYLPERFETARIRVRHYGYLNQRIAAKDKSRRNIQLLEQEAQESRTPFTDYNLGSEYIVLGDHAAARLHLDRSWAALREQGLESVGYAPLLVSRAARARREVGDFDAAVAAVEEGLARFPDHTDLVLEAALTARSRGDLRQAAELAERCLEMGDAPAEYASTTGAGTFLALTLLAEVHAAQGDRAGQERILRRCLTEHPGYIAPVLPLVELLIARGVDPAEIDALVPGKVPARLLAGSAYIEGNRPADAERWFRGALEAQPSNSAARMGLSESLLAQRRFAEAAAVAAGEPAGSPLASRAAEAVVFASAVQGDADAMDAAVERALPSLLDADADLYRAWASAIRGREPAAALGTAAGPTAVRMLEALLRVTETNAFTTLLSVFARVQLPERQRRELLATMYLRRGFLESAADEWIAVATTQPDASAMLGLAQVALARGYDQDAVGFAAEAVRLEPGFEGARIAYDAIVQKLSQVA